MVGKLMHTAYILTFTSVCVFVDERLKRTCLKRQINFLSLLVREMAIKYLKSNYNDRETLAKEEIMPEQLRLIGELVQDRVVQRLSDRFLPAKETKEGNRLTCLEVFPRPTLVIDKIFEHMVSGINMTQPRPRNDYARISRTFEGLLPFSKYQRLTGYLPILLRTYSLIGATDKTGKINKDATISKLPVWFRLALIRYRGERTLEMHPRGPFRLVHECIL